ncbi:hypothetical protein ACGFWD_38940 [Streptomyces sp. NPDC048448]|uniref:hypothetical protein n=1 Tax=Streptomyces sp. NPDC048448 TaxID=3365554 RepID=UPI003721B9BF
MTSTHPRKRPQRHRAIPRGPQQDTGLQQIRDTLPPAPAPCTVEPAPRPVGDEVPLELLALVSHHCRRINAYVARALHLHLQTLHGDSMKQWQRLVLYALSDALAHNHLLSAPSPPTSNARTSTPTCMTTSPPGPPTH